MQNKFALILLVNQAGDIESSRMLPDRLLVGLNQFNNLLECNPRVGSNSQKNLDAIVIGQTLQMSLHLFGSFELIHVNIIHQSCFFSYQQTPVCKDV